VVLGCSVLLACLVGLRPSGYLTGGPGPVHDLGAQLADGGTGQRWLLLTVRYEELTWAQLAWSSLQGRRSAVLGPGTFHDALRQRADEQMARSTRDAATVAGDLVGRPLAVPEFELGSAGGGSGGLAMTLALLDAAEADLDLSGGRRIAATGTIDDTGRVGAVGGVREKAVAARAGGAEILFVARANVAAIDEGPGLTVVPVDHITEAVSWLCATGGRSSLCGREPR
jgi:PDZ domain-containing secreted protein